MIRQLFGDKLHKEVDYKNKFMLQVHLKWFHILKHTNKKNTRSAFDKFGTNIFAAEMIRIMGGHLDPDRGCGSGSGR